MGCTGAFILLMAVSLGAAMSFIRPCTLMGCPAIPPKSSCHNIRSVFPNGRGCGPDDCFTCADGKVEHLTCPMRILMTDPRMAAPADLVCTSHSQCTVTELCCPWGQTKICIEGIDPTPRTGSCPSESDAPCVMDSTGCSADSQCPAKQKCCYQPSCYQGVCMDAE